MNSQELMEKFKNSHLTSIDMTVGDADEVLEFSSTYQIGNEVFFLKYEEICELEKINKNWHKLDLDNFKSLLFMMRL